MNRKIDTKEELDVIIIGGGATGAGIARDCSLRGIRVLLLERKDISTGATGRNHGLLHSGARYAVTDRESAEECIKENMILKRIASHCVEDTSGLFITLPEDDLAYQATFVEACTKASIPAEILDPMEALRLEPSANAALIGAVRVPDGAVDPFRLTAANILDAKWHGAKVLTYHEVVSIHREQDRVVGVQVYDKLKRETKDFYAPIVVNACGIWGHHISNLAGVNIEMLPSKGSLLIFGHRVNNMVVNRCRKPADADILVPGDTICIVGTTSVKLPYDEIDNTAYIPNEEIDLLLREAEKLSPILAHTRILRAYAGVRPLVSLGGGDLGRNISRGIVLLDHAERDGLEGFITITGGKLMTYRLMAEEATDLICRKLHVAALCQTAIRHLPGSQEDKEAVKAKIVSLPIMQRHSTLSRHGDMAAEFAGSNDEDNGLICECEGVSVAELKYAIDRLDVNNLIDLRRRTRIGMGTCQGEFCIARGAGVLSDCSQNKHIKEDIRSFLNERWSGIKPIAWGDALREAEFSLWIYEGVCGIINEDYEI